MKQVIIIHGKPGKESFYDATKPSQSNKHWFPWIQKQLSVRDELCQVLEMPRPYEPVYADWLEVFKQLQWNNESILIGHSCGAGFLLRFLSENKDKNPKKLILVAPWLDPDRTNKSGFCDFEIDTNLSNRTKLHIFISSDDNHHLLRSFAIVKEKLPNAIYHEFTDKGHFTKGDLGTEEFPELLEIILN